MAEATRGRTIVPCRELSGRTVFYVVLASVVLAGPFVTLTSLTLFVTLALCVVAAPLLLLFSPVLVVAVLVIAASVAAFSAAGAMAVTGMAVFGWAFRQVRPGKPVGIATRVLDKFVESGDWIKAHVVDSSGYLGPVAVADQETEKISG